MKQSFYILLILTQSLLAIGDYQTWNGNQIANWWSNDGRITSHVPTGDAGMEWPVGSGDTPVFAAGLWVVARHVNGIQDTRSGAAEFSSEYVPGPLGSNPDAPEHRIYMIRAADGRANPDWDIWPVDQGAPWIDVNGDGSYDPAIDTPDIKGDLYYWTVFNDGNEGRHSWLWSTPPLGIEVRAACYGFEGPSPLENTLFFEWNIRNAGSDVLDTVVVGVWQDIDLGSAINDYPGCVPELDLSYHYVGELPDSDYGFFPPAVGFTILQGPAVPSVGDTAYFSGTAIPDHRNLPSTAFFPFNAYPENGDPENATEAFRAMQGLNNQGGPRINPMTNEPDPFIFSGNPLEGTGWLASNEYMDGDWRGLLSSGNFSLAPGDSQQVVAACVISPGMDPLAALAALFDDVETVHEIFEDQFTSLQDIVQISEVDVPHNTESSGPFTFQFQIVDAQGQWDNDLELRYKFDGIELGAELSNVSGSTWEATVPESQVSSTSTLNYHIRHIDGEGGLDYWPSGAPLNNQIFTFGPDTDPPILAGLETLYDVHYLLPFSKTVTIDTVYDARFGIDDIWLNWTIGGSDIMTAPMLAVDSNEVQWYANTIYRGEMGDVGSQVGNTVRYWVTAMDGSQSNLAGNSEVRTFTISDQEIIADLDHVANLSDVLDWQPFEHGSMSSFNDGVSNWLNVVLLALAADGAQADTMEMIRELDLTPLDQAWVNIPMVASFRNEVNYGLIQVKAGGIYHTVDSLYGSIPAGTYSYDLSPFLDESDVSLRILVDRGFGSLRWIIDDIVFHSDPDLVGVEEPGVVPNAFALEQNYPNPFNPSTRIRYAVPQDMNVAFTIYDVKGREVLSWAREDHPAGWHGVDWNGLDRSGEQVATGIYFGHLRAGNHQQTIKMVLIR